MHLRPLGSPTPDPDAPGRRRASTTTSPHGKPWGIDMVLYLLHEGIVDRRDAASAALLWLLGDRAAAGRRSSAPAISLVFIALTAVVLVVDLERPERFYYILTRPNWRSWMVWGAWFLTAHGALSDAVARAPDGSGCDAALLDCCCWPVDRVAVLATCVHRASCSRRAWRAISGRGRTPPST